MDKQAALDKISVTKKHGTVVKSNGPDYRQAGRKYFMMYHPAAALRFPPLGKEFIKDFKKLKKII